MTWSIILPWQACHRRAIYVVAVNLRLRKRDANVSLFCCTVLQFKSLIVGMLAILNGPYRICSHRWLYHLLK
jgi:hypothetical protein